MTGTVFCFNCLVRSRNKAKEQERFYLLPGQGGENYRRKQRQFILWSVVASLFFGAVLAGLMFWLARQRP